MRLSVRPRTATSDAGDGIAAPSFAPLFKGRRMHARRSEDPIAVPDPRRHLPPDGFRRRAPASEAGILLRSVNEKRRLSRGHPSPSRGPLRASPRSRTARRPPPGGERGGRPRGRLAVRGYRPGSLSRRMHQKNHPKKEGGHILKPPPSYWMENEHPLYPWSYPCA